MSPGKKAVIVSALLLLPGLAAGFSRPAVSLERGYTSIITSENEYVTTITVENPDTRYKDLNISLQGPGLTAAFVDINRFWAEHNFSAGSTGRFQIRVQPQTTGKTSLDVVLKNKDLGITTIRSIPVYVRESAAVGAPREAPGIGAVQFLILATLATFLYSSLL